MAQRTMGAHALVLSMANAAHNMAGYVSRTSKCPSLVLADNPSAGAPKTIARLVASRPSESVQK